MEVEIYVPLGILNASKLARTLHVPGQFVPVSEGMQRGIAQLAFEEVVPMNIVLEFKEMHSNLNTACESGGNGTKLKFIISIKTLQILS
jgi:hypothetical protein